jgi:hypothetical protein
MIRIALVPALLIAACGNHAKDPKQTAAAGSGSATFHLRLGDATVYELVDRRWQKVEPPRPDLVLHADGTAEMINDKTGKPSLTFHVTEDGKVLQGDTQVATITEHGIVDADGKPSEVTIDGNTASVAIENEQVKVTLAPDGKVTVVGRPDGVKWRIDAHDPAVSRTAFFVLALTMKTALD